jgi:NAD(P)-dependent dehydrogenase (short-subunit alcohol dehydrogenase family)
MAGEFAGKVALVTGAGSGIGRATALAFARAGAAVVVADVDGEGGERTAQEVRDAGGDAIFAHTDVSRAASVEALIEQTLALYGRLDCAHNNAGVAGTAARTADYAEDAFDQVIAVNLKGVWLCLRAEIRAMLATGGGAIVNTSSAHGLVGGYGMSAYAASKHGVVGLTKTAAIEYARRGIRVNAICPGAISTPMSAPLAADPRTEARVLGMEPIGRWGTPEEVAGAVLWLCSDAASYVTGLIMPVDGGMVAQ